jgi:hypothetical protein
VWHNSPLGITVFHTCSKTQPFTSWHVAADSHMHIPQSADASPVLYGVVKVGLVLRLIPVAVIGRDHSRCGGHVDTKWSAVSLPEAVTVPDELYATASQESYTCIDRRERRQQITLPSGVMTMELHPGYAPPRMALVKVRWHGVATEGNLRVIRVHSSAALGLQRLQPLQYTGSGAGST